MWIDFRKDPPSETDNVYHHNKTEEAFVLHAHVCTTFQRQTPLTFT